jgi:hypothetical protein
MAQPLFQMRINEEVLEELRRLVPLVQAHPNFRTGRVTVQDVARLALSRGIEQLKRELEQPEGGHR